MFSPSLLCQDGEFFHHQLLDFGLGEWEEADYFSDPANELLPLEVFLQNREYGVSLEVLTDFDLQLSLVPPRVFDVVTPSFRQSTLALPILLLVLCIDS